MSFVNEGFRSKKTISIGVCLEYGLICSTNVTEVVVGEWNYWLRVLISVPVLFLR